MALFCPRHGFCPARRREGQADSPIAVAELWALDRCHGVKEPADDPPWELTRVPLAVAGMAACVVLLPCRYEWYLSQTSCLA